MKTKGKCICCGGVLSELMIMPKMPRVAQHMPTQQELSKDTGIDLSLCQCNVCGLVQFDVEPVWYYKDVIRAGGGTSTMHKLRTDEYNRLLDVMGENEVECHKIIEIGCGKGEFLTMWKDVPEAEKISCYGIENDPSLVMMAKNKDLLVEHGFAENGYIHKEAPFDAFVQFNFLEHQPNPVEMLKCIRNNLKSSGYGLLTVPSFEYIIQYDGYYELMRDHIAYYTIDTLKTCVKLAGFDVVSHRLVNRDTIEMIIRVADTTGFVLDCNFSTADITKLKENYEQMQIDVKQLDDNKIAVWGASHQAFTLAATTALNKKIKYIIDSAEFKQGKYSPASHIQIVSPDYFWIDPVKEILIVAPGYTDEIADTIKSKYGNNVKIMVLKEQRIMEYI